MDKYKFGEFVYQRRKKLNITQEELGMQLGVTNKAVSKWETGETLPDIQLLDKLASALNVTLDELFTQQIGLNQDEQSNRQKEVRDLKKKIKYYNYFFTSFLIGFVVIICILTLSKKEDSNEVILTKENIQSYISFEPCSSLELANDFGLKITSQISLQNNIDRIESNIEMKLFFTLHYFYQTLDGDIVLFSFINEEKEINLLQNEKQKFFVTDFIAQRPLDFFSFSSFEVECVFSSVKGQIKMKG